MIKEEILTRIKKELPHIKDINDDKIEILLQEFEGKIYKHPLDELVNLLKEFLPELSQDERWVKTKIVPMIMTGIEARVSEFVDRVIKKRREVLK